MKKKLMFLSGAVLGFAPVVAFAASPFCSAAQNGTVQKILCQVGDILNAVIPIVITLAIIYFIWGVVQYVISGDEDSKAKGRNMIIYGIIGIAVIIGVWGLANLLLGSFGVSSTTTVPLPTVIQ